MDWALNVATQTFGAGCRRNQRCEAVAVNAVQAAKKILDDLGMQHPSGVICISAMVGGRMATYNNGGKQYHLPLFERNHACCTCHQGVQGFFCKHHVLALQCMYPSLPAGDLHEACVRLVGTSFGSRGACQLGVGGMTVLTKELACRASSRADKACNEARTLQQPAPVARTSPAESQGDVQRDCAPPAQTVQPSAGVSCSPFKRQQQAGFPDALRMWDEVRDTLVTMKDVPDARQRQILAGLQSYHESVIKNVQRPRDHQLLLRSSLSTPAAREVNTRLHEERRHKSAVERSQLENKRVAPSNENVDPFLPSSKQQKLHARRAQKSMAARSAQLAAQLQGNAPQPAEVLPRGSAADADAAAAPVRTALRSLPLQPLAAENGAQAEQHGEQPLQQMQLRNSAVETPRLPRESEAGKVNKPQPLVRINRA